MASSSILKLINTLKGSNYFIRWYHDYLSTPQHMLAIVALAGQNGRADDAAAFLKALPTADPEAQAIHDL